MTIYIHICVVRRCTCCVAFSVARRTRDCASTYAHTIRVQIHKSVAGRVLNVPLPLSFKFKIFHFKSKKKHNEHTARQCTHTAGILLFLLKQLFYWCYGEIFLIDKTPRRKCESADRRLHVCYINYSPPSECRIVKTV